MSTRTRAGGGTWGPWSGMRVPEREDRPARTYPVDPAAVENLRRIIEERETGKQEAREAALQRAAERVRAKRVKQTNETPAVPAQACPEGRRKESMSTIRRKPGSLAAVMTRQIAERWATWRREGWSYDRITQTDDLHPSAPSIKDYLKKYGFDKGGERLGNKVSGKVVSGAGRRAVVVEEPKPHPWRKYPEKEEAEPEPVALASAEPALPATTGEGDVTHQLAALQQLVSTLTASDVRLSGRIRVELVAEIAL